MNVFHFYIIQTNITCQEHSKTMFLGIVRTTPFIIALKSFSQMLVKHTKKAPRVSSKCFSFMSVGEKIRTPDLLVRSQTLYPAELRPHNAANRNRTGTGV